MRGEGEVVGGMVMMPGGSFGEDGGGGEVNQV